MLGFPATSVIATVYLAQVPSGKAAIGVVDDLRTWLLILAFVTWWRR